MTTAETAQRVIEFDEKSTPGPIQVWEIRDGNHMVYRLRSPEFRQMAFVHSCRNDADMFAFYRTAAPELARRVLELEEEEAARLASDPAEVLLRESQQRELSLIEQVVKLQNELAQLRKEAKGPYEGTGLEAAQRVWELSKAAPELARRVLELESLLESAIADFRKLKPFIGGAADATADLYQKPLCSHT